MYTIKSASKMGDYDETYGQAYWAYAEETQMPLKFNSKTRHIEPGARVTAEEKEVKNGKKGEFLALKKVKIQQSEGAQQAMPTKTNGSLEQKVDEILAIVKELRGDEPEEPPEEDSDKVDLSDIPW